MPKDLRPDVLVSGVVEFALNNIGSPISAQDADNPTSWTTLQHGGWKISNKPFSPLVVDSQFLEIENETLHC